MTTPLLSVRDLVVSVATHGAPKVLVDQLSFDLDRRETLCIAGESGSGKSMTALALMRLLPPPYVTVTQGAALLAEKDLFALTESEMRAVRGRDIGMIFQEPMTSLNPVLTIGRQLVEAIGAHKPMAAASARAEARRLLDMVQIPEAGRRLAQYPFELSGGMRQRVMIAIALAQNPSILIADEPTTALDVTVQAQILSLIRHLQHELNSALILITHDMGVVAEMADRVLVMRYGREVEHAPVRALFAAPAQPYTRELLAAVPVLGATEPKPPPPEAVAGTEPNIIEVDDLIVRFDIRGGLLRRPVSRVHAVEGVSLKLGRGETLALVGESGCGKSTIGKAIMNLVPWSGSIRIAGQETAGLGSQRMKPVLRNVQMIFQDPYASLDPRMRVGELVAEPLVIHGLAKGRELEDRAAYLFERVGLSRDLLRRYPHEFSGGQRQRICIARALSLSPKAIIADESVSALDVSIQAQVLELLQEIQRDTGVACIFISHDMAVVERISQRIAVMYMGRIVETGASAQVLANPQHTYTQRLLAAVPVPDPTRARRAYVPYTGELPSPVHGLDYQPPPLNYTAIADGHLVAVTA
ncbi:MAG TPA: ABC transporter ATP-binding protein [Steroidobacteraceae bacterium]|nr:ABC transporter ATP-binding protein [Steroidobacteraceae bacterium]